MVSQGRTIGRANFCLTWLSFSPRTSMASRLVGVMPTCHAQANVEISGPKPHFMTIRPNALGSSTTNQKFENQLETTEVNISNLRAKIKDVIKGASEKIKDIVPPQFEDTKDEVEEKARELGEKLTDSVEEIVEETAEKVKKGAEKLKKNKFSNTK